jgi:hypothetical protein
MDNADCSLAASGPVTTHDAASGPVTTHDAASGPVTTHDAASSVAALFSAPPPPSPLTAQQGVDMIQSNYMRVKQTGGDIFEHIPTLAMLASRCESVAEFGVRGVVSSWAFAQGLLSGLQVKSPEDPPPRLLINDLLRCPADDLLNACRAVGIRAEAAWGDDLGLDLSGVSFDMVFIDTWHVYAHLRRELAKFAPHARRYIVMHDTTVDAEVGESVRCGLDVAKQARESGYPVEEIARGLWPAVTEFLETHRDEWRLMRRWTNNNGLTVLERVAEKGA